MELDFDWRIRGMIPCMNKDTIKYLYNTADERYNFSKDFFRETHYSQVMTQYYKNEIVDRIHESQFLEELEEKHHFGNRVYIIFGSTGSGKSELLCWIKDQWNSRNNKRPIVRISRSELNPQLLVKKCYESVGVELEDIIIDEKKWELFLSKPITIVNQMVWSVMSELFDNDEEIIPATMLLRPVIEKNITEFSKQVKQGEILSPLEIITQTQFQEVIAATTIPFTINYDKLRDSLLKNLDHFLFQGTDIKSIFKRLSAILLERNVRPILLIDDLVQSINLYAPELLDYFITLEEGNWDVVIGLTPGVIDGNEYETQLKNRIKSLDTIDDRVKKLWLSDESGSNFFTMDREQSKTYIRNYLSALKKANGFHCSDNCPLADGCSHYLIGTEASLQDLPLNQSLINRIYDAIPDGKGVLRYLIIHLREVLSFLEKGKQKSSSKVRKFYNREVLIEHEEVLIKTLAEMYADETGEVTLPGKLLQHFHYVSEDVTIKINKIDVYAKTIPVEEVTRQRNSITPHLRDWIEGQKVNEQLLEPVRSGVFTIVNEFVKGTSIAMENTPRMIKASPTIQRTEVKNRFKYPIAFKESENHEILIKKHMNLFHIAEFQQLKLQDRVDVFSMLANDQNVSQWIYQGEQLRELWLSELSEELGMSMETFSYQLKIFVNKLSKMGKREWTSMVELPITPDVEEVIESLFLDWFSLRDNMIDYYKLDRMSEDSTFEKWFLSISPSKVLNKYQINNMPLQEFLMDIQNKIRNYLQELILVTVEKIQQFHSIKDFVRVHSEEYYEKIVGIVHLHPQDKITLSEILQIDEIETWFSDTYKDKYYLDWQKQHFIRKNLNSLLPYLYKGDKEELSLSENKLTLEEFQDRLVQQLKVRKQVSRHILNLIEQGQTDLPKKQWRGILRDLDEFAPDMFDKVTIKMLIETK
jgi:hypothetical protein